VEHPRQIVVQPPGLSAPIRVGDHAHVWNLVEKNFAPFIDGADFAGQGLDVNAFDASIIDVFPTAVGAQTAHLWYVSRSTARAWTFAASCRSATRAGPS
jgi:hypothetical protein